MNYNDLSQNRIGSFLIAAFKNNSDTIWLIILQRKQDGANLKSFVIFRNVIKSSVIIQ